MGIPRNVKTILQSRAVSLHQTGMAIQRANARQNSNYLRAGAARQTDEPGPATSAAIKKVLQLPNG